jgi:hypothetical protein
VPEEEGLQRFDGSLTRQIEEYNTKIATSSQLRELTAIIADTNKKMSMRFKREHTYKLEKFEERLYKEVIYDTRPDLATDEVKVLANPLKKAKYPSKIRNMAEAALEGQKIARWPIHPQRIHRVNNMHEPSTSKMVDPYHWIQVSMTAEDRNLFKREEEEFYNLSLFKYDMLHKQLLREQEFYQHMPKVLPVRIGEYIYYRRFENPADAITLYRFPIEELKNRGLSEGQLPNLNVNHDDMIENSETISDFPEETVLRFRQ